MPSRDTGQTHRSSGHLLSLVRRRHWPAIGHDTGDGSTLIVNGHPDPRPERFCAALCNACLDGARANGQRAEILVLGAFPSGDNRDFGPGPASATSSWVFDLVRRSNRLIVVFPLWLDRPPPALVRFFGQAAHRGTGDRPSVVVKRSVHFVVTMALPAFAHRSMSRANKRPPCSLDLMLLPSLRADKISFIGSVDAISQAQREDWLDTLRGAASGQPEPWQLHQSWRWPNVSPA